MRPDAKRLPYRTRPPFGLRLRRYDVFDLELILLVSWQLLWWFAIAFHSQSLVSSAARILPIQGAPRGGEDGFAPQFSTDSG